MILEVDNLYKSYGDRLLFVAASLQILEGEKVAILGSNGSGKTTLLKILVGQETGDQAKPAVKWANNIVFEYLAQQLNPDILESCALDLHPTKIVEAKIHELSDLIAAGQSQLLPAYDQATAKFNSLGAYDALDEFYANAERLGLPRVKLTEPLKNLSGGERMRAELARVLSSRADVLILDEPSNHLDIAAVEWLEEYLKNYNRSLIFVSHDRHLIDKVATTTVSIVGHRLHKLTGNYSTRLSWENTQNDALRTQISKLKQELKKEQEITQTLFSHRNISGYHSRQKRVDKLSQQIQELETRSKRPEVKINFEVKRELDGKRSERVLLKVDELKIDYGNGPLFSPLDLVVRVGERIVIAGPNACGKTSIIKAIFEELPEASAEIKYGDKLKYATLDQHVLFDNEQITILEEFLRHFPNSSETEARSYLARFAFYDQEVFKKLIELSGGERSRLKLLLKLLTKPDLLVLDEPTNHLDLKSKEVLEEALSNFSGAILTISHDRHFIEKLEARVIGFKEGEFRNYNSWDDYRDHLLNTERDSPSETKTIEPKKLIEDGTTELSWKENELKLCPELGLLPKSLRRPAELRQFKAKARSIDREILDRLDKINLKKELMEETFSSAKSSEIYHDYALLQAHEEELEELYLKLAEILESLD
ncbi:MAG: ABC-F family ATP-binding cassette domain-containing protein [Eubacteriales bacterium]|nr:ABC-F family ATP-binding cassette domain-containing protein [Eubacteriales bacterium]